MASGANFGTQQYFGFDPRAIPGCQLWLDAADSRTITTATGVSQWDDKSGNSYNLTQSTGGSQPTQSGNYIVFSSNRFLNIPQASINNASTYMMSFVFNPIASLNWIMVKQHDGVNTYNSLSMTNYGTPTNTTGSTGFLYWKTLNAGTLTSSGAALATSTVQLITLIYDGTSLVMFRNGTQLSSTAASAVIQNVTIATNFTMGMWNVSGVIQNSGTTNFQLGEFVFYNTAPTSLQRQQVEGYLAWKWGLQANLPTGHPYKPNLNVQRMPQPPDFGPMLFWWDAAEYSSFTPANPTTGTSITGWRDKINGVTLSNVNVSPTWSSNGVVFTNPSSFVSASTQNLIYSNTSSPYRTTQNFTIFVAHAPNSFTGFRAPFHMIAPNAFNTNPSFVGVVQNGASEGNWVGAFNGAGTWLQLQQAAYVLTTAGAPRVDTILSAPSNFTWTNGTENTYSINNIGRGTTVSGTATITALLMSTSTTVGGNRVYDGTIYEVLVYSSNLSSNAIRQVEGYLGWKWKAYRNLVTTHPFYNIPTSSPLFTPTALSNCNLWLDALDTSTFTPANPANGAGISAWSDKSGCNYTFTRTQGTDGTYSSASNSLLFTASNAGYTSSHPASVSAETLFMVFTSTFNGSAYVVGSGGSGGRGVGTYVNWTRLGNINNTVEWGAITANGSMTGGARNIGMSIINGSATQVSVNGGTSTSYTFASPPNSNARTTNLGMEGTSRTYSGHIHEIVAYSRALGSNERQAVEGYLAWKWGLQNNLPTTHPYYKFRP